jgi:hypothetical protein
MRLAFHNGEVHSPQVYMPNLYTRGVSGVSGVSGLGVDYAQEFSDAGVQDLYNSDPNSSLANFAAGMPSAAMTGYADYKQMGGGTKGAIIGGAAGTLAMIAPFTGPAAPFVLLAAALIGPIASMFKGCGATCTQASAIADRSQQAANQIMDRYKAEPIHYYSIQQAALAAMQDVIKYLQGACSSATLGAAGQRCISERLDPNACFIKDDQGGCHNFWIDYINPIKNDPTVVPDPIDTSTVGGKLQGLFSSIPMPLVLGGAGIVLLLLASGDGK